MADMIVLFDNFPGGLCKSFFMNISDHTSMIHHQDDKESIRRSEKMMVRFYPYQFVDKPERKPFCILLGCGLTALAKFLIFLRQLATGLCFAIMLMTKRCAL